MTQERIKIRRFMGFVSEPEACDKFRVLQRFMGLSRVPSAKALGTWV